jgi:hypothetical protein
MNMLVYGTNVVFVLVKSCQWVGPREEQKTHQKYQENHFSDDEKPIYTRAPGFEEIFRF